MINFTLFHFIRPIWLIALLPYLLLTLYIWRHKQQRGSWTNVCDADLLPYLLQDKPTAQNRLPLLTSSIASFLTIIALAGPTWERVSMPAFRNDTGLVIALDLSRSMEAADIQPSRLVRARYKIADILHQRKDGQTALLVYAGEAFTVTPLTNDNATIASQLEALDPNIMPSQGSHTATAVAKSVALLQQAGLQKGHLLLVTDGVDAAEMSETLAKLAGYQLSILAVGTEQGAPIKLADGGFLKDNNGNIVIPKLPVATLQQLARNGNGIFQSMTDNDDDIKNILAFVDQSVTEAAENSQNKLQVDNWEEKGVWLLVLILPLAALHFRRGILSVLFALILIVPHKSEALEWRDLWQTKDQQAQQAFNKGDYNKAAQLFENPAWQAAALYKANQANVALKTPAKSLDFYNQGNVFAKQGFNEKEPSKQMASFKRAIISYNEALKRELNKSSQIYKDATFNKKIVEDELKKLEQNSQNKQNKQDSDSKDSKEKQQNNQNSQQNNQNLQNGQNNKTDSADNKSGKEPLDSQQNKPDAGKQNQEAQNQQNSQDSQSKNAETAQNKPATEKSASDKNQTANSQAATPQKPSPQNTPKNAQAQALQAQQDEKIQADAQWLNRIPDDPAGLLKRKFKYQYSQMPKQSDNDTQAW